MATPKKKESGMSNAGKMSIGAGITAAAVAAAGAFFLYGSKNAKKNRSKVASWAEDAKQEVLKGLEKAKTMTEAEYKELIEKVSHAQAQLQKVSKADLTAFQKEMKDGWKVIAKNVVGSATEVKKTSTVSSKGVAKPKSVTKPAGPKAAASKKESVKPVKIAKAAPAAKVITPKKK